jgi:hypothetical protein
MDEVEPVLEMAIENTQIVSNVVKSKSGFFEKLF